MNPYWAEVVATSHTRFIGLTAAQEVQSNAPGAAAGRVGKGTAGVSSVGTRVLTGAVMLVTAGTVSGNDWAS